MQRGRSLRLWFFLAAIFVLAVGFFARRSEDSIGQTISLADGTELTLHAVTYGQNHFVVIGPFWQRVMDRMPASSLPRWPWLQRWQQQMPKRQTRFMEDKLVLWFLCRPASNSVFAASVTGTGSPALPALPRSSEFLPCKIVGPGGYESDDQLFALGGSSAKGAVMDIALGNPALRNLLRPVVLDSYPRSAARFTVKLSDRPLTKSETTLRAATKEFVIRNPAISQESAWTPAPLPVQKARDSVTCILTELVMLPAGQAFPAGTPQPSQPSMRVASSTLGLANTDKSLSRFNCQATFQFYENGGLSTNWRVTRIQVSDATGNTANRSSSTLRDDGQVVSEFPSLWPDEPAWELRVEAGRWNAPPDRMARFERIPFPNEPGVRRLVYEANLFGRSVKMFTIGRRDTNTLGNPDFNPSPGIVFEFDLPAEEILKQGIFPTVVADVTGDSGTSLLHGLVRPLRLVSFRGSSQATGLRADLLVPMSSENYLRELMSLSQRSQLPAQAALSPNGTNGAALTPPTPQTRYRLFTGATDETKVSTIDLTLTMPVAEKSAVFEFVVKPSLPGKNH